MIRVPCVLFAFNRPEKFKRILKAIKHQNVEKLIIFIDGPRNSSDIQNIEECQKISREIDWVETELYISKRNYGLKAISEKISFVFHQYPVAIFIEDDCLPMPGFYDFLCDALDRYSTKTDIFSICGYQPLPKKYLHNYHYSLVCSPRFMCWGWATWKTKWEMIEPYLEKFNTLFNNLKKIPEIAGIDIPIVALDMINGKTSESWDVKVAMACVSLKLKNLIVTRGLIKNIGFDFRGTHRGLNNFIQARFFHNKNIYQKIPSSLDWLEGTSINCEFTDNLNDYILRSRSFSIARIRSSAKQVLNRKIFQKKQRIFNLNLLENTTETLNKKALLSYIVHPFNIQGDDLRFKRHINIWHAYEIVRVLNKLGFSVDIIDYRDREFFPRSRYDLFIGHGGINYSRIANLLPKSTRKIYFSTGSYWQFHNNQEEARFEMLYKRKGVKLPYDRFIRNSEEEALKSANGIIAIGNKCTENTYIDYSQIIVLNGTTLYDEHIEWCKKDYETGRKNYMFFSGVGNIHKGLDLLIEAFQDLEQHLWICSKIDPSFRKLYKKEICNSRNIHLEGWIQPRSQKFYSLMRKCNFCILPTCSEGQAQSVIECMNQGLIPIVSRFAGIDVENFGFILNDCSIDEIKNKVKELSQKPVDYYHGLSLKAREVALRDYSEENFTKNFSEAVTFFL